MRETIFYQDMEGRQFVVRYRLLLPVDGAQKRGDRVVTRVIDLHTNTSYECGYFGPKPLSLATGIWSKLLSVGEEQGYQLTTRGLNDYLEDLRRDSTKFGPYIWEE